MEDKWCIPYNINRRVKVYLTEYGRAILTRLSSDEPKYDQLDSDGYYTFQLWQLMQIFGSQIGVGIPQVFENNS